ncbi:MAG: hypothetical protein ACFFFG_17225 [Candidatus Thorarchaeota archaeon]
MRKAKVIALLALSTLGLVMVAFIGYYVLDLPDQGGVISLDLIEEDPAQYEYINLTEYDLTSNPTLKRAIDQIIDPSQNKTRVWLRISLSEIDSINNELLVVNGTRYGYLAYHEYLFSISFAVPSKTSE